MNPTRFNSWLFATMIVIVVPRAAVPQVQDALVVETVLEDSAAAKIGFKQGDRVLSYNGRRLASSDALQAAEENTLGKEKVVVDVQRGDEMRMLTAPLGKLGIQVRPGLSSAALKLYEEGKSAQRAGKTNEVIMLWTAAARAAHESSDTAGAAWLYARVGGIHESNRQWKEASAVYGGAWELLKRSSDRAAQSRTLTALGRCSQNLNGFTAARQWYAQAAQVDEAANELLWLAADFHNLANVARERRELAEAEDFLIQALRIREQLAAASLEVADTLTSLGGVAGARGQLETAQDYLSRALVIQEERVSNSLTVSTTLNNLGNVARARGDLTMARDYHSRALAIKERLAPGSLTVAASLNNLGNVARELGDMTTAQNYHENALAIKERLAPGSLTVSSSLGNLGIVAKGRGDLIMARDLLNRSLAILERLAPNSLEVANNLDNLGSVAQDHGDLVMAQDYHNRALAIREALAPNSMAVAMSLYNLALVAGFRGDLAASQAYDERALSIRERLAPNSLEVAASLNNLGSIALKQSRFSDALRLFDRAVDIVENQRRQVRSAEGRALLLAQHTESYTGMIRTRLGMKDAPAAFAAAESARARSLLEILTEARTGIRQGVDPALLDRERSIQQALNDKAYRQALVLDSPRNEEESAAVKKELDSLLAQYREVQEQIRIKSPRYASLTQPRPLGLPDVQQSVLDKDTLLLEYVLGEEGSHLFAVTANSIHSFELPKRADVERAARRVVELLMARQPVQGETARQRKLRIDKADAEYPAAAAVLSQLVLGPVTAQLSNQRLLIVADGALQYVPFGALPAPEAKNTTPLIVNHEVVSLPSASVLAVQRRELQGRQPAEKLVAVLADPVFNVDDPRMLRARRAQAAEPVSILNDRRALSRLPFTREEADAILSVTPPGQGIKALDFKASRETAISAELGRYRIVHLATHGMLNTEHPELSGIVLSLVDEHATPLDGFLRLHEVYNLNWSADLVVLSACQTGLGKEIKGEGLVGLTRGFMYAGAKSVLASLWNVNDSVTAEFMRQFYRGLFAKGLAPAAALRAAQVEMSKRKQWNSPYYWAAFVLHGDWK